MKMVVRVTMLTHLGRDPRRLSPIQETAFGPESKLRASVFVLPGLITIFRGKESNSNQGINLLRVKSSPIVTLIKQEKNKKGTYRFTIQKLSRGQEKRSISLSTRPP